MHKFAPPAILALSVLCGSLSAYDLPQVCYRQGDPGMCKAAIPRWHYNPATEKCEEFTYGGCGGYVPFKSLEKCQTTCKVEWEPELGPEPKHDKPKVCYRKGETGPCRAAMPAWQFNMKTGKCEKFTYGGCDGFVPFRSVSDCQKTCAGEESKPEPMPEPEPEPKHDKPKVCYRKGETGPCRAAIPAWQFNMKTGKCEKFTYGGCDGFVPFRSVSDCQKTCAGEESKPEPMPEPEPEPKHDKPKVCYRKGETGPCRAAMPAWQFNMKTGKCEKFTYGGCKGFVPFRSVNDCQKTCGDEDPVPVPVPVPVPEPEPEYESY
ncbi:hypothetical protein K493DRAFT_341091 [Basidiobolus meristosporus CBS 931.73]|uniref:BPTI/Kunitz inhibitor domain-containing protein n=1 Tax=Basidiobolus meristosporus CBS 931.73 TaxID=1314790 RepID=A0A1Y1XSL0_9FUNG|nr:hypothetical protein K493DRAFT_341091 [Basidiobolus meristosporus CBS 931.73]|eukprot:ORX88747.1 hypothetical protein K493DRAFT_341091 [Basidiobolus meristosporus CBS 931.73]